MLRVAGYPISEHLMNIWPDIMTVFQESDKRISDEIVYWESDEEDEAYTEHVYEYSAPAWYVAQRLDIMGFTVDQASKLFEEVRIAILEGLKEGRSYLGPFWMELDERIEFFSEYDFEKWKGLLHEVISNQIVSYTEEGKQILSSSLPIRFILDNDRDFFLGFPWSDIRHLLRAVLEVVEPIDEVSFDFSELVENGSFEADDKLTHIARASLANEYINSAKIIVLTEGSTDANALSKTLALLYPHLSDYYSFLNFGISNIQGGAPDLVKVVKAFIGSGIENKTIAIFDNDTAAKVALKGLRSVDIPENIAVMCYPSIAICEGYPTIGPQGIVSMNVNGLAGSLEMYFGLDVLMDENGNLSPVQWRGYDQSLDQYQGEVLNKRAIQEVYFDKLERCLTGQDDISNYDWSGMEKIFGSIFSAFRTETRLSQVQIL